MSYDFYLFENDKEKPFNEIIETLENGSDQEQPDNNLKENIYKKIIENNSDFEIFQFDYSEIAKSIKTTIVEAKKKFQHIELNKTEPDKSGIQITIYSNYVTITIPFWHRNEIAEKHINEIMELIGIIKNESGYIAYDPQIEKEIDENHAIIKREILDLYNSTTNNLNEDVGIKNEFKVNKYKKWWEFWK
jgi:hypothetical protein